MAVRGRGAFVAVVFSGILAATSTTASCGDSEALAPPLALGALCSLDIECFSGLCVEGVCCDRVCDSGCEACNLVDSTGTCRATPGPSSDGVCEHGAVCSTEAACAGGYRWGMLSASAGTDEITAAASGLDGGLLLGGRFTAELRLGASPLLTGDPTRASGFVLRLNDGHEVVWALNVGQGATVEAVVDADDAVYIAGTHSGSEPLWGELRQADAIDGYVAALDDEGVRWVWFLDGPGTQRLDRLAKLPDGGVVVGARYSAGPIASTLDAELIALGADGVPQWSVGIASPGNDRVGALAVDAAGGVVATGTVNGPVVLGGETLEHRGAEDVVVLRVTTDGLVSDAWSFGGAGSDVGQAIVPVSDGGLFVAGFFTKSIDFGDGPMLSAGCEDVFLTRLDAEGRALFSRRFGDAEPEVVSGLALTPEGTLVAAGDFEGSLDFGWGPLVGRGDLDLWVASFGLDGEPWWARAIGGADRERVHGFAVTADALVIAGRAHGAMDLDGAALSPVGGADGFVAELLR